MLEIVEVLLFRILATLGSLPVKKKPIWRKERRKTKRAKSLKWREKRRTRRLVRGAKRQKITVIFFKPVTSWSETFSTEISNLTVIFERYSIKFYMTQASCTRPPRVHIYSKCISNYFHFTITWRFRKVDKYGKVAHLRLDHLGRWLRDVSLYGGDRGFRLNDARGRRFRFDRGCPHAWRHLLWKEGESQFNFRTRTIRF